LYSSDLFTLFYFLPFVRSFSTFTIIYTLGLKTATATNYSALEASILSSSTCAWHKASPFHNV